MSQTSNSQGTWRLYSHIIAWERDSSRICSSLKPYSYGAKLASWSKHLLLPQELEAFNRDSDVFLSVLLRSLDRYFANLVEIRWYTVHELLVKYASKAEIDALPFPNPRLIPTCPDINKYYARISRAFLHLYSYPGMTTCRCEIESERNIGLLLYSFFDWFATISYGPRVNDIHDLFSSIRIFNRNFTPQWTTDDFAPIVFLSLPLSSLSKEIQVGEAVRMKLLNGHGIPDFLVPMVTTIQPGLNALVLQAIENWKRNRKTVEERFVMPDWLFIHGVVYDAMKIQLYACTPKIKEFDADGVPSSWEYACLSMDPFYLSFYGDRETFKRHLNVITLLQIQCHTARISKALQELKLASFKCNLSAMCDSALATEESREKGVLDVFNLDKEREISLDEKENRATECLIECMDRTGLYPPLYGSNPLPNWIFFDTLGKVPICESSNFLAEFPKNWRPASGLLPLPQDWLDTTPPTTMSSSFGNSFLLTFSQLNPVAWTFFQTEPKVQLGISISPHRTSFTTLSEEAALSRHFDPTSFAPDFYLAVPARKVRTVDGPPISTDDLAPSTLHSLEHFKDVIQYMCHEIDAKAAISSLFRCIPGCWLKCDTQSRFPSSLAANPTIVDFSLLLHPIQTVPVEMVPLTPDVKLRSTVLNPALVMGIQGPTSWPDEFACPPSAAYLRPKNKTEALRELAKAIEPSLKVHLINWQLRFEQGLTPTRELPPWFMLFGVIYDAEEVNIVAHIPVMDDASRYSFLSSIVDTISFPLAMPSSKVSESWYLDRFRVALALLSLQKHAFRMAGLWECVAWPYDLISWEEIVEREYLGPVLTPLERGYMVKPHPMAELYREIHGSDEPIDDNTMSVDDESEDANGGEDEDMEECDVEGQNNGDETDANGKDNITWQHEIGQTGTEGKPSTVMGGDGGMQNTGSSSPPEEDESEMSPWNKVIESWRNNVIPISQSVDISF